MAMSAAAMPIVVAGLDDVPAGESPIAGMVVGVGTLALVVILMAILMLRGSEIWRLMAFPITLAVGCAAAMALGVCDIQMGV